MAIRLRLHEGGNKFYNGDEIYSVRDEQFRHDLIKKYSSAEMEIIYIELTEPKNLDFLKIDNDKKIKTIVLSKLDTCDKFKILLSDDKKNRWSLVSQIITKVSPETKRKIFRSNNAEYKKFYKEMVDKFTAPSLLGIDEYDLLPFKEFTAGCVYVGETEFTVGSKDIEMAIKETISKAENFADAQDVHINILGSDDNIYMPMVSESESAIHEVAPHAECVFTVQVDNALGDMVRVTVVAKIP